jgi:hypothetical protein
MHSGLTGGLARILIGKYALLVAAGAGAAAGLVAVVLDGGVAGAGGAAKGVGSAVVSAPHWALRKSFHFSRSAMRRYS